MQAYAIPEACNTYVLLPETRLRVAMPNVTRSRKMSLEARDYRAREVRASPVAARRRLKAATLVRVWHCAEQYLRFPPGDLSTYTSAQRAASQIPNPHGPVRTSRSASAHAAARGAPAVLRVAQEVS